MSIPSITVKNSLYLRLPIWVAGALATTLWSGHANAQDAAPSTRFYQDYRETSVAPETTTEAASSIASNEIVSNENRSIEASASPTPTSLSEPVWVIPDNPVSSPPAAPLPASPTSVAPTPVAPTTVTVPPLRPAQSLPRPSSPKPPNRPANPAQPSLPPDLAVIATDVQVLGADPDLQQYVLNTIKTKPGGQTSQVQLQQDVKTLLDTGLFVNATVSSRTNPNGVSVTFQVQPIVVQGVRLSGAQVLTQPTVEELFRPQIGTTISPTVLSQSVQRVNQWYAKNGYTLARVLTVEPDRNGILTVTVAEGVVGDIRIRFLNKEGQAVDQNGQPIRVRTQEPFVRRQILLQPGQVFREEAVRADLRRLSELGIFESINVGFEGDARLVTVVYNLVEGRSRGFNFGGGYNEDLGVYGTISYSDTNFGGLAQRFNASTQIGIRDIQFDLRFVSPYRANDPATPGYGVDVFRRQGISRVFEEYRLPNGDRVRERRYGVGGNLNKPLGPTWNGSVAINYQNISIRDSDGDVFATDFRGLPLTLSSTGVDDLTTVTFAATRDQRDNPTNPSRGSFLSISSAQTIPIGRGNILGNTVEANFAQYVPVNIIKGWVGEQPQVLAFNVQGGTVFGDLPPYNAYSLGGVNSVRGYDFGEVAVSRSYVLASAEYRFPIYRFIGGVVFFDVGSGLGTQSDVPGEPGEQLDRPGSGFGGGLGLRFNSPIGIIRTELGINNQGEARFHFGFGQRF